jgi:hypothetical protein
MRKLNTSEISDSKRIEVKQNDLTATDVVQIDDEKIMLKEKIQSTTKTTYFENKVISTFYLKSKTKKKAQGEFYNLMY